MRTTLWYLAKYITKSAEGSLVYAPNYDSMDGKHYGYVRRDRFPICETRQLTNITQEQVDYLFAKHHEYFARSDTREGESFSIMGQHVEEIIEALLGMRAKDWPGQQIVLDDGEVVG